MSPTAVLVCQTQGTIVAYEVNGLLKGALISGPDVEMVAARLQADGARLVEQGALTLRLGVALYDRPFLFVPASIITETGATIRGEAVFAWLRRMAYDMPRSEVFGVNARGVDDQVFARDVDVESSPIVVGGPSDAPVYVAVHVGTAELPPRFAAAVKICALTDPPAVRKVVESA
jgi:hypothetical protein